MNGTTVYPTMISSPAALNAASGWDPEDVRCEHSQHGRWGADDPAARYVLQAHCRTCGPLRMFLCCEQCHAGMAEAAATRPGLAHSRGCGGVDVCDMPTIVRRLP